ncbi:MAG: Glutamyl-tRNA(Gln) amidotransferase subunit C, mitochondrial [candidate division TM6 bacterium GW2011_GWF2_38_10]|nr:MAG: Glutamyl-tRNA(Gln) amidotransferase subunit C, mitochondrial [candidate division TM6 bacterium GW2011_GWF2_38_10]
MSTFNQEELKAIAKLSGLSIGNDELALFTNQITKVLSLIDQLQTVSITSSQANTRNVNIMRTDMVEQESNELILGNAPQSQESYFVVPTILDEK